MRYLNACASLSIPKKTEESWHGNWQGQTDKPAIKARVKELVGMLGIAGNQGNGDGLL